MQQAKRSYVPNAVRQRNIDTQDRLQHLLNGDNDNRWCGFRSEDEEEQALEVSLLLRKSGKVPAIFYD